MIATLRQRNFALLWTAGLFALLGNWAIYAVLPLYLYQQTGSTLLSGLVWAVVVVPSIVVGPIAGVYVDRWDRRLVMFWVAVIQATVMAAFAVLASTDIVWIAYAVVIVQATLVTFSSPAETALLPSVVAEEFLISANALNGLNDNLARIAGPMVGTLVFAQFGLTAVAVVNAGSYLLAALLVRLVRIALDHEPAASAQPGSSISATTAERRIRHELAAGIRVVWQSNLLRAIFLVIALLAVADAPLTAMLAPFVDGTLDAGPEAFGTVLSVRGIAGILGGMVVAQFAASLREDWLIGFGCAMVGLGVVAMAIVQSFLVTCLAVILLGPAIAALQTGTITLFQRGTDDRSRGRVFALLGTVSGSISLLATVTGSALGDLSNPESVIGISGMTYIATGAVALFVLSAGVTALNRRTQPAQ